MNRGDIVKVSAVVFYDPTSNKQRFALLLGTSDDGNDTLNPEMANAVNLQNELGNQKSPYLILAPIYSDAKAHLAVTTSIRADDINKLDHNSYVDTGMVRAVPKDWLLSPQPTGKLSNGDLLRVEASLKLSLGLSLCHGCRKAVLETFDKCSCGTVLKRKCVKTACFRRLDSTWEYCPYCGAKQVQVLPTPSPARKT